MMSEREMSSSSSFTCSLSARGRAKRFAIERAVERGEQRRRHGRTELRRVGHVGEHGHHADDGADHAPGRRAIPEGPVDLGALLQVLQEDVAVALHGVLDEVAVVAVGHVAEPLRQEGVLDLHVLEGHRAALADHLGDLRDLRDEVARVDERRVKA